MKKIKELIDRFANKLPAYLRFTLSFYVLGMVFFTFFRLVLMFAGMDQLSGVPFDVVLSAFGKGLRFDTVISGYILALPFVLAFFGTSLGYSKPLFKKIIYYITSALYLFSFAVCAADVPYFNYYNIRLTVAIFNWFSTPDIVWGMLTQNLEYIFFTGLFLVIAAIFILASRRYLKSWLTREDKPFGLRGYAVQVVVFIFSALIMFAGMRDRVRELPIKWSDAYFSIYPFPNQMGLNANYTLLNSYLIEKKSKNPNFDYMNDKVAFNKVQQFLNISGKDFDSPIARIENLNETPKKHNVVLIFMESMSVGFLGSSGKYNPSITPFLDKLKDSSVFFPKFFADGIHTFNGVWSVLTSMPSIPDELCPMSKLENAQRFAGFPSVLQQNGYSTFFACPHDAEFDNIGGFAKLNGYEKVSSQLDFLSDDYTNNWGVSDHTLFEKNFDYLNTMYSTGKPFFATFLTVSNHGPYKMPKTLPPGFKPRGDNVMNDVIRYCDASLKAFIEQAKKAPWFDNTIFVFVADHGRVMNPIYENDYWHKHIPLYIYAPKILTPQEISGYGQQIDIFPTVMDLLKIKYVNNTLGINLFKQQRDFAYFSANFDIGAIDDNYFFWHFKTKNKALYDYKRQAKENYITMYPNYGDRYEDFAKSMYQTEKWMIKHRKVGPIKVK